MFSIDWGTIRQRTPISGYVRFGSDRAYVRFTELHLPGGRIAPICLSAYWYGDGIPMEAGSTRTEATVRRHADLDFDQDIEKP
jgi:hypothetical protein